MNPDRLYNVLREPHISEKVSVMGERSNQYAFKVASDASKFEIKRAVEGLLTEAAVYEAHDQRAEALHKEVPIGDDGTVMVTANKSMFIEKLLSDAKPNGLSVTPSP